MPVISPVFPVARSYRRRRPRFSLTSSRPSGRNDIAHGSSNVATTVASKGLAGSMSTAVVAPAAGAGTSEMAVALPFCWQAVASASASSVPANVLDENGMEGSVCVRLVGIPTSYLPEDDRVRVDGQRETERETARVIAAMPKAACATATRGIDAPGPGNA